MQEKEETDLVKLLLGRSATDDAALNERLLASVWDSEDENPESDQEPF